MKRLYCLIITLTLLCGCSSASHSSETDISSVPVTISVKKEQTEEQTALSKVKSSSCPLLECDYYIEKDFMSYISQPSEYSFDGEISCGIVPHHLTAGNMIAGFFDTAATSQQNTDTVIIIATKHYSGVSSLCTTYSGWQTPFGTLENDTEISARFIDELSASESSDMLELDHSASGLIPFVKYYFPNAKVSTLLVEFSADEDTPERLSELLAQICTEKDCLVIFSIDFSHYLVPELTHMHDEETRSLIEAADYEKIAALTDDNVDSPLCLNTFLMLSSALGKTPTELDHSNSMLISQISYTEKSYPDGITSYFIYAS